MLLVEEQIPQILSFPLPLEAWMTVDDKLSWIPHVQELKKSFANKVNLLKRSRLMVIVL